MHHKIAAIESKITFTNDKQKRLFLPPIPLEDFRKQVKNHLERTLVSIKAKNKVVTKNKNRYKFGENGSKQAEVTQLTPRGQLHKETVYGKSQFYQTKPEKVGPKFDLQTISMVSKKRYREALLDRLHEFNGDPKKAFGGKNALTKNPIYLDKHQSVVLPEKVQLVWKEERFTIRKPVEPGISLDKVLDGGIRKKLEERLARFNGNSKDAFSNLDKDPIWLNKEKGICIKTVAISGVNSAIALGERKDHFGKVIMGDNGMANLSTYVQSGNNHHAAIFIDTDGNIQENVVSFMEAVARVNSGKPIIDKEYNKEFGWQFLFTLKSNEYFLFPDENNSILFTDVDALNEIANTELSKNLFRVQKFRSKDYFFRHHLETNVDNITELHNVAWKRISSLNKLQGIVKVAINHLGKIVHLGEY
jgi:CRISPR-associated endonuclease Csn1